MLTLPPLPCGDQLGDRRSCRWDKAYSFAYHPTSGRYKVVHVPCIFERAYDFDAVQVLTVEKEATWREVLTPGGARCNLKAGVVSVDGTTYWVTKGGAARVVSLSLDDDERVAGFAGFALPSPALSAGPDNYHLAEVRGRLGVVVHDPFGGTTGVWVRGEKGRWTRRCGLWSQDPTRPHFVHGEHVTTFQGSSLRGYCRPHATLRSATRTRGRCSPRSRAGLATTGRSPTSRRRSHWVLMVANPHPWLLQRRSKVRATSNAS
ncbi:uncharacterized protein [Aegilops tauschii subsp. strangulata]|uniref:uncharacterized protein n=1 Tax=Aegilops tauschii subsp. strangulata TaxID=200361 RepID=UPI001ABC8130|nr:uncharacterized protein LOC109745602 [Aegilops tauschii subsp. strangulata]